MATIRELEDHYNPENDLIPEAPRVLWTEYQIIQIIKKLEKRIAVLEYDARQTRTRAESEEVYQSEADERRNLITRRKELAHKLEAANLENDISRLNCAVREMIP